MYVTVSAINRTSDKMMDYSTARSGSAGDGRLSKRSNRLAVYIINSTLITIYTKMAGFHPHMPATRYSVVAKTLGASMWFWVMYKAKEEGPVVLVRYLSLLFLSYRTRSDVQEFAGAMARQGRNRNRTSNGRLYLHSA